MKCHHNMLPPVGNMHIAKVSYVSRRRGQKSVEHDLMQLVSIMELDSLSIGTL